ncbi:MAG: UDP-N-acetylmuramate--L-alanine ligase [Eubacteriales bacterium]
MSPTSKHIENYIKPGCRVHLVGIGGVSMRPLGLVLRGMGMDISGSDMSQSPATEDFIAKNVPIHIGHRAENIQGAECLIRTAAVHNDNPEIAAARALGIPIFERAQAWGHLMKSYKHAICLSGTHGKTTTTSMMAHIAMAAELDPTIMIGGHLPLLGAGHRVGQGDTIIMESCEYCNSFHKFFPTVAVILNVEADHLDFFKDLIDVEQSFRKFAMLVPEGGHIIANGDDQNTIDTLADLDYVTFGFGAGNNIRALRCCEDFHTFDVAVDGQFYGHFELSVVGKHNVYNALAAISVAVQFGISADVVAAGLSTFTGAGRRMERKGTFQGADVYDDYAHHPGELHALLTAVKTLPYDRIICAFQPHTYTRTNALFDDFVRELKQVDVAVLAEIYAAREQNTIGISSSQLADEIPGAVYCETLPEVTECLKEIARPGDLILTVGAGDIFKAGEALVRK